MTEPMPETTISAQVGENPEGATVVVADTLEQGQREIAKLVEFYRANRLAFLNHQYTEAEARQQFIDGLFMALGWNVRNEGDRRLPPHDREVVIERSTEAEGHRGAPDYTFRIGESQYSQVNKFLVEAKKPSVNIRESKDAARQVRTYAWLQKLPLAIITNFEELAVYNGRGAVPSGETAVHEARIRILGFADYAENWQWLWDKFSREAVRDGRFDAFVASEVASRGTLPVDDTFLQAMEKWRKRLASDIARHNPHMINAGDLTSAVQTILDRLVFLRMAEDREIEPQGSLQRLAQADGVYSRFLRESCRAADEKYNSDLFDLDKDGLTPRLVVSDQVLRSIIEGLYFPCPYSFRWMPVEVLGSAYERFLGKVIRLTSSGVRVEDKPEVRKAGGVYYTPAYIVNYIVRHTVGRAVAGKAPAQLAKGQGAEGTFRVLDMACGSGSFLLGAYQLLLNYCLRWYMEHSPETHEHEGRIWKPLSQGAAEQEWRLTVGERKRILTTHVFGVDIDRQAVEVTKLSLLLKVLERENKVTLGRQKQLHLFQERALPNPANNIKCGNSLIAPDFWQNHQGELFDANESARINAFDWRAEFQAVFARQRGGFSVVVGNPPYLRMEGFKKIKDYLRTHYKVHEARADYLVYFVEQAHNLLRPGGRFGMILSNKLLRANFGKPLREFLRQGATVERIVDFAGLPVFEGATVRTIILLTHHGQGQGGETTYSPPLACKDFEAVVGGSLSLEKAVAGIAYALPPNSLTQREWGLTDPRAAGLMDKLRSMGQPLADYCEGHICRGVVSGLTAAFEIDSATRAKILRRAKRAAEIIKPLLTGREIRRYRIDSKQRYLIYTYHGVPIERYGAVEKHLEHFKPDLKARATRQEWYELQQPQFNFSHYMDQAKIVWPDMAKEPRFALDDVGYYGSNTTYFIPGRDLFLLGLLNSRLAFFYFSHTCAGLEGKNETYLRFIWQYLAVFPVRRMNLADPKEDAKHHHMIKLVEDMITLNNTAATTGASQRTALERQMQFTDTEIDNIVYDLYGLTQAEIRIVEGAGPNRDEPDEQ